MNTPISRRRALALGGSVAGSLVAGSSLIGAAPRVAAAPARDDTAGPSAAGQGGGFSQATIKILENILGTDATQLGGVIHFGIERKDLQGYTLGGNTLSTPVPYLPSWENNGDIFFESLGGAPGAELAIMNGDFGGLLPQEIDPFIDRLLAYGLVFQAFHMHFTDIHPNELYYIHMRGIGDPLQLARGVIGAIKVTGTPLPQFMSGTPTTPLPTDQLSAILGGPAEVGEDGVVTVYVPRQEHVTLQGDTVGLYLNVATSVSFEPLNGSGSQAAVAPDFGMISSEVQRVIALMRQQGWVIGCLYNQETDEVPQLYFSHQVKVGDPITLAQEVRRGLDQMNTPRP